MISGSKEYCTRYIAPFQTQIDGGLITNVDTSMDSICWSGNTYPTTQNDKNYDNSYVCSPYNAFISCGLEEMDKLSNAALKTLLKSLIKYQRIWFKLGSINKNYIINNYLLSTNLYPEKTIDRLGSLTRALIRQKPNHALIFRCLNYHSNEALLNQLKAHDYLLIPIKQVYVFDKSLKDYTKSLNFKRDKRLLNGSKHQIVTHDDFSESDYIRMHALYNALYLTKHSKNNPQFSEALIRHWHCNQLFNFMGLRNSQGVLDGVIAIAENKQCTCSALFGYDTSRPKELGLYRCLIHLIMEYSNQQNKTINLSSGAPHFKKARRGLPFIEYIAVYVKHLPWNRRFLWHALKAGLNSIYVPLLHKQ